MPHPARTVAVLFALALLASACGSDAEPSTGGQGTDTTVDAPTQTQPAEDTGATAEVSRPATAAPG